MSTMPVVAHICHCERSEAIPFAQRQPDPRRGLLRIRLAMTGRSPVFNKNTRGRCRLGAPNEQHRSRRRMTGGAFGSAGTELPACRTRPGGRTRRGACASTRWTGAEFSGATRRARSSSTPAVGAAWALLMNNIVLEDARLAAPSDRLGPNSQPVEPVLSDGRDSVRAAARVGQARSSVRAARRERSMSTPAVGAAWALLMNNIVLVDA